VRLLLIPGLVKPRVYLSLGTYTVVSEGIPFYSNQSKCKSDINALAYTSHAYTTK